MKIIDIHAHWGKWFFPIYLTDTESILAKMRRENIEKIIFSSLKGLVYDFREGNKELKKVLDRESSFYGWVEVNPHYPKESFEEMERYLPLDKFVGLGELYSNGYVDSKVDSPGYRKILEKLLDFPRKTRVLFHCTGQENVGRLIRLAKEFSQIIFILAHANIDLEIFGKEVKDISNLYFEISGANPPFNRIEELVNHMGTEKIFFGSDLNLLNPATFIGRVKDSAISPREREAIFYYNALRIFRELNI